MKAHTYNAPTVTAGTIARTACLLLALANQVLSALGKPVLPIESATVEQLVTAGITTVTALVAWWKNNSFTPAALEADKTFDRHAASWEHIARIAVRHLDPETQRNLCDLAGLQGAVIGHIYIRPGVVIVRPVRAVAIGYAKVNQFDLHRPPPAMSAG